MIGEDYQSFDSFMAACRSNREPLDPRRVLGKIYPIDQLRKLANHLGISHKEITEITQKEDEDRKGVSRRYRYAEAISQLRSSEEIGKAISYLDHDTYFPVLTYYGLSNETAHKSSDELLKCIFRRKTPTNSD